MTQNQQQQQPPPAGTVATSEAGAGAGGVKAWEEANARKRAREDQQAASSSSSAGAHKRMQVKKESSADGSVVNKSIKQEDVSRGGNAQREATPMPVPISQANCAAGPSTTSQQQAAPAPFQQRSIHATMPLGLASSSHRHLPSPCVPPPLSAYFHAPQQGSHPQQTSYTHHGPSAIPPPRFPDPWYSSAAYHSARQSLNLVNDISIQVAVLLDEARWYEKSFSSLAPYPTWLSDRQAEVQEIVWRYQGSWRRFEKHVAAAARLALLELERAAGLEQGGG